MTYKQYFVGKALEGSVGRVIDNWSDEQISFPMLKKRISNVVVAAEEIANLTCNMLGVLPDDSVEPTSKE